MDRSWIVLESSQALRVPSQRLLWRTSNPRAVRRTFPVSLVSSMSGTPIAANF
ncbi:hypothetical protein [Pararobbsia alpina]|uniref:hypothetical protein n=1 Tax=Pararobbsia alpina TaxID=621374 RepID=UPI0039A51E3C